MEGSGESSRPHEHQPRALGSRYELEERLGVGAMGEVWRALDRQTGQHLAAKVLRAEYARDAGIVTRFIQERSILLDLTHPNIVRVRDLVVEGERLAIVMDLVEGGDLRRHLREHGPVAPAYAVPLACVVLDALASAHSSGCLHRDVKPDNVLLARGDVSRPQDARLSDFSIARLAQESTVQSTALLGTPGYMPPELFRDGQFSGASDVYATGVLLYELLGGRTPFAGTGTAHTIGHRHVTSAPPPLPVSAPLWEVIERMLAKDPRARLGAEATAAVLRALSSDSLSSQPLPPQPMPDTWENVDHTVVRGAARGRHLGVDTEGLAGPDAVAASPPPSSPPLAPPAAPEQTAQPEHREHPARPAWVPWAAGAAAALLVAVAGIAYATRDGGPAAAEPGPGSRPGVGAPVASAQLTDPSLPIGATIARAARYDPATDKLELSITYAAGSTPVAGPFLEVFPPGSADGACPLPVWDGPQQRVNNAAATGVRTDCDGYVVDVEALPAQGRTQVSAVLSGVGLDLESDPEALQTWLANASTATSEALTGPSVHDDEFPVQRLRSIWMRASRFSVRVPQEIGIEIGPVFANDEEGPAFFDSTDVSGSPSGFLQQVAGGYSGVRVTGCSAVRVNAQQRVSPLRPADDCLLTAEVGKVLTASDTVTITGAGS